MMCRQLHIWCIWVAVTIFVYPIPGTMALRNLLLAIGLSATIVCVWRAKSEVCAGMTALTPFRTALLLLLALSLWMIIHLTLLAWYPNLSWEAWSGGWIMAWLTGGLVLLLARLLVYKNKEMPAMLATSALVGLLAHIAGLLVYQLALLPSLGAEALGRTPFAQRDYHSTLCLTAFSLLLGEFLARRCGSRLLMFSDGLLRACIVLTLVATITLVTRNGTLMTLVMVLIAAMVHIWRNGRAAMRAVAVVLVIAIGFAWLSVRSDSRWERFIDTLGVSMQIHENLHWLDPKLGKGLPKTADGLPVEESAYDRVAWATAAIEQIAANPLGVGFGHMAFGWAVNRAFNVSTGHESSHSGILDFTLANGIPGTALWLAMMFALLHAGWIAWHKQGQAAGLLICMHVLAYNGRIILDGHFSGFRFRLFIFVLCLLIAAVHAPQRESSCSSIR